MAAPKAAYDTVLILDFGSQYTQLIARKLRELQVYCEIHPYNHVPKLEFTPIGVIFSGGPASVYDEDAPHVDASVFELGVPILGICYGLQEMAWHYDNKNVAAGDKKEYGSAILQVQRFKGQITDELFKDLDDSMKVWMSHGDKLAKLPSSFVTIATTSNSPFAGIAHSEKPFYGIQFHPEVTHTPSGVQLLRNFAVNICKAKPEWTMGSFKDIEVERIRNLVGPKGQVIGAVSGGVDSTVAAKLMHEAIGSRFHPVLVDNGLLRLDEASRVKERFTRMMGMDLTVVDASKRNLGRLAGVTDPEKKRKIIGNAFIEIFVETAKEIEADAARNPDAGEIEWLLQGTLYPDVIESVSFKGPSHTIKTHHNVGGLPEKMQLKLIEPLRELFKDEVRKLGLELGIDAELVGRHPFPGPGLGVRVMGGVTEEKLQIARHADNIFIREIRAAGIYNDISQAYAAVGEERAVGVMGDRRYYGRILYLRAVQTVDFMTATFYRFNWDFLDMVSTKIVNEVVGVSRVVYDTTSKPPGTIEME
ncbi:GMP synthase [Rhizodiscina lignyota]|uniref:GMP synthase [glutamine-hydrolyzing] n=1 Tax=Rhizodiscina lignyota TaxID=1504668 RepID=A0A9P4MAG2_9PEZI|nr:GMP synthase [Rhizodiscina lignyota]